MNETFEGQTVRPRPRLRIRIRLTVRALMAFVLIFGIWLGWYLGRVREQQAAVAAIKRAGGWVDYDWEWGNYNPDILDPNGKPRAPRWLADRVGVDYVANVVAVSLVPPWHRAKDPNKADDETLAQVGRLRRLESLWLNGTAITDAGLAHVARLTGLRDLHLMNTRTGDAGLAHLEGLTRLVELDLAGTRVTDDGVLALEWALPRLRILREEDMLFYDSAQRAAADLDFARSRPIRLACALLAHRARLMATRGDEAEFAATIDALCDLEADDKVSLVKLAEARSECLGVLEPTRSPRVSASARQALRRKCADRGIDALARAIELGYDNTHRLDGGIPEARYLWLLRSHPAFPRLLEMAKVKHPGR